MEARFLRNIPALTEEECEILRQKQVLIAGCGGLGGYLAEFLARLGVGSIRCVDGDRLEESNLNRQLLADRPHLGMNKAQAAAQRIRSISPDTVVEAEACFLDEGNAPELISGCHAVLDGLDNVPSRKILSAACSQAGVPYIYGAVEGWVAQAAISIPGDGLMEVLYPRAAKPTGVLSFTPALCAALQASLCVRLLVGRPVEPGKLYYFDLLDMDFAAIPLI